MKLKLRCKNEKCESQKDQTPLFTVNMSVDEDGDACENAKHIGGEYFTCSHCGDNAQWIIKGS